MSEYYRTACRLKTCGANPKTPSFPGPDRTDRNQSGFGEHLKEYFRVGSGRVKIFRVESDRGMIFRVGSGWGMIFRVWVFFFFFRVKILPFIDFGVNTGNMYTLPCNLFIPIKDQHLFIIIGLFNHGARQFASSSTD